MFSFTARKKAVTAERHIRRMIDLTIPNDAGVAITDRYENRFNRSIPVLLCPWERNEPVVSEAVTVVTKDIGDRGVGLILTQPYDATEVVLGFCLPEAAASEPSFFLGTKRSNVAIGGGFWLLGVQVTEFMNETWHTELAPLFPMARKLLPPSGLHHGDPTAAVEALVGQAIES